MRCACTVIFMIAVCCSQVFALDYLGPTIVDLQSGRAAVVVHTEAETELVLECFDDKGKSLPRQTSTGLTHLFDIDGLNPETTYTYRISSEKTGFKSPDWIFKTPALIPGDFNFIVYGDSRDGQAPPKRHRALTDHFLKHNPAFVIHTGDLLMGGKSSSSSMFHDDWKLNFFAPLSGIMDKVPFYIALGNHDQDTSDAMAGVLKAFPKLRESFHYSFRVSKTHFTILHIANQMREYETQRDWFIRELSNNKDADWRIVILHVSPITNGKYRDYEWTLSGRQNFILDCFEHGADLVFSGHDHSYQRFKKLKRNESDSHSVQFIVTGLAGTNPYHAEENEYSEKIINKTDHFCSVEVSAAELKVTAYDNGNMELDRVTISKRETQKTKVWRPGKIH